jgi:hypothetical protein
MVGRGRLCVHGCNLVCALFVVVLERSERGMHLWHSLLRCVCVCVWHKGWGQALHYAPLPWWQQVSP